jgi:hypothetical protein
MLSVTNMLSLNETTKEIEKLLAVYGSLTRPDLIMHIPADAKTVVEALDKLNSEQKITRATDEQGVEVYQDSSNLATRFFYAAGG